MSEIGKYLRNVRGEDSLREASKKTGLSHNYISVVEKGIDPRSGSLIKPSPETLLAYSNGYHISYEGLMAVAGYIEITNDQARNAVLEEYNRLPQEDRQFVDDMIKRLSDKRKQQD